MASWNDYRRGYTCTDGTRLTRRFWVSVFRHRSMTVWWRLVFVFRCFVQIPIKGSSEQMPIMTSWARISIRIPSFPTALMCPNTRFSSPFKSFVLSGHRELDETWLLSRGNYIHVQFTLRNCSERDFPVGINKCLEEAYSKQKIQSFLACIWIWDDNLGLLRCYLLMTKMC